MMSIRNPMPPLVSVNCSSCKGIAQFEFATHVEIAKNIDLSFFEKSKYFELIGRNAIYFHGLSNSLENIENLPTDYKSIMWSHKKYWQFGYFHNYGVIKCNSCSYQRKHVLDWPKDAYFTISYRGKSLWAFDRETAIKLLTYIESKKRIKGVDWYIDNGNYKTKFRGVDSFLLKIPECFQSKKARGAIVKKLRQKLKLT